MCNLDVFESKVLIDMSIALAVNAGNSDADDIIRTQHATGRLGARDCKKRQRGGCRRSSFQKPATGDFHR